MIIPIIKNLNRFNQYQVVVYAKDFALKRISNQGIDAIDICNICGDITYDFICSFLKKENPIGVITGTSLNDFTERFLWKAASLLNIYSCAIIDQWVNLGIRFSKYDYCGVKEYQLNHEHPYLPSRIIVIDEFTKTSMIQEGIPGIKITVCGSPHFDTVKMQYNNAKIEKRDDTTRKRILFASEPISIDYGMYWGFTEKTVFNALSNCLIQLCDELSLRAEVIIRPHPREKCDNWNAILNNFKSNRVSLSINNDTNSFELMKNVDIVCGMSSMFLIESAICNVPIISILIGLLHESPFILDQMCIYHSMKSETDLYIELKRLLQHHAQTINFNFVENATENALCCIEEDLYNEHIGD